MPYFPEDIIIIIFRYLHRYQMKLLNQEYHSKFELLENVGKFYEPCLSYKFSKRINPDGEFHYSLINYRSLIDNDLPDYIYHSNNSNKLYELKIKLSKNY